MAKSSSNNRNFSIRIPEGLIEKIDNEVESYQNDPEYMNCEIFMDGDRFAIVARWKVCA